MFAPSIIMRAIKSLPQTGWFSIGTATGTDYYTDVKLDTQSDAIYTSGFISDATYLAGGGTATDALLSKFNSTGVPIWQVVFGGALADATTSLAVASDGSIYVTGLTNNAAVGADCYLAKFDATGTVLWARSIGSTTASADVAGSVSICSDGGVVMTASLVSPQGTSVLKFDSAGTLLWKRHLTTSVNYSAGVLSTTSGDVYVTLTAFTSSAYYQTIVKYNTSGTIQWQTRLTGVSGGTRFAMVEGTDGSIFVASRSSTTLGTIKFSTTGTILWQTKTSASTLYQIGCAVDSAGNVYSSGYSSGNVQYVIKQDASGARLWQRTVGAGYDTSVACLPGGELLIAGGNPDSVIMKYPTSLPIGTYGGRVFADPTAVTITAGTQVQSASTLVESASTAVVQDATWITSAYRTIPQTRTTF